MPNQGVIRLQMEPNSCPPSLCPPSARDACRFPRHCFSLVDAVPDAHMARAPCHGIGDTTQEGTPRRGLQSQPPPIPNANAPAPRGSAGTGVAPVPSPACRSCSVGSGSSTDLGPAVRAPEASRTRPHRFRNGILIKFGGGLANNHNLAYTSECRSRSPSRSATREFQDGTTVSPHRSAGHRSVT